MPETVEQTQEPVVETVGLLDAMKQAEQEQQQEPVEAAVEEPQEDVIVDGPALTKEVNEKLLKQV